MPTIKLEDIDFGPASESLAERLNEMAASVFFLGGMDQVTSKPAETETDANLRRLVENEGRLRKNVKEFFISTEHVVSWDEIVGNDEARIALIDAIESPIKQKSLCEYYGTKPSKGVLLSGPPGCGKTMFGKAAASVLAKLHGRKPGDVALLVINGPQLQSPYVGKTEEKIRNIFAYARAFKALHGHPLVVFIDEADAILPSRDGRDVPWFQGSNVAAFLTEMDGMEESGAFVVLATNRPFAIDAALLRDGRCDRKIKIRRPTETAARAIMLRCLNGAPVASGFSAEALADQAIEQLFSPLRHLLRMKTDKGEDFLTLGHIANGAMIAGLVERAKMIALRRDIASGGSPSGLCSDDFEQAVDALTDENVGNADAYALQEFIERTGAEEIHLEHLSRAPLKARIGAMH